MKKEWDRFSDGEIARVSKVHYKNQLQSMIPVGTLVRVSRDGYFSSGRYWVCVTYGYDCTPESGFSGVSHHYYPEDYLQKSHKHTPEQKEEFERLYWKHKVEWAKRIIEDHDVKPTKKWYQFWI